MDQTTRNAIEMFKDKKILVIGDIMLDRYIFGDVERISPEAPIPIIHVKKEKNVPGGAANTANNVSSLGGKVFLIGVVGNDSASHILIQELERRNINQHYIVMDKTRPTIKKVRIISQNQQMIRIDYEDCNEISIDIENTIIKNVRDLATETDAIIISDYVKGTITENIIREIKKTASASNIPVIVDSKSYNYSKFSGVFLVTPNKNEAAVVSGLKGDSDNAMRIIAEKLAKITDANILITRGADGMSLLEKGKDMCHIQTEAQKIFDVSGAGDTVVATLALGIASGLSLKEAAILANRAAGIIVEKPGTATVSVKELTGSLNKDITKNLEESIYVKQSVLNDHTEKIEKIATDIIEAYRSGNKILVFGNGGSACDAQHFVGELVGRFKIERKGLPAIALNADTAIITSVSNDYGYENIFSRQIETLGNAGDIAIGITTSGNSQNIINAMLKAKEMDMKTIGLLGKDGGKTKDIVDTNIIVPSDNTPRIQETHIAIIHTICDIIEKSLFVE